MTRKSIEDDNLGATETHNLVQLLTRRLVFDVAEDPYVCSPEKFTNFCDQARGFTDSPLFTTSDHLGQFDKKIAPKKVRIAVEIKTTGKERNPARF